MLRTLVVVGLLAGCTATSEMGASVSEPNDLPLRGSCNAEDFQNLIGQPLSKVGGIQGPSTVRVTYPWQAVTNDLNLSRLNLLVNEIGVVQAVTCG